MCIMCLTSFSIFRYISIIFLILLSVENVSLCTSWWKCMMIVRLWSTDSLSKHVFACFLVSEWTLCQSNVNLISPLDCIFYTWPSAPCSYITHQHSPKHKPLYFIKIMIFNWSERSLIYDHRSKNMHKRKDR